ncbi:tail assembly protein, partial [Acinetobacter baumannii]
NANTSGSLVNWLREKAAKFAHYRVLCEFQDGTKRQLSDEDFGLVHGELKTIRFVPVVVGAGGNGVLQTVVGVVLLVASIWYPALLPTA